MSSEPSRTIPFRLQAAARHLRDPWSFVCDDTDWEQSFAEPEGLVG